MEQSELHKKAMQTLKEFESLEDIQPSAAWNHSLMKRLESSRVHPASGTPVPKVAWVLLIFILANVGLILSMISGSNRQSFDRGKELRAISSEFLINPTSISQ